MNHHPCGNCGHTLAQRFVDGKRELVCPNCGYGHAAQTPTGAVRKAVENTLHPEAVAGPKGADLWSVDATVRRMGGNVGEQIHVRAASQPGAIGIAQEMLLDVIHMDVYKIDEGSNA